MIRVKAMRDYLLLYVNSRRYQIGGEAAFAVLSDFLRGPLHLTGAKVVCAEGDCGACTVLVGTPDGGELRYQTVDSCIQFLCQLDGKHIVTVEGLGVDAALHPAQRALIEHHGSQCGYCTPGFVMALAGAFETSQNGTGLDLCLALTGNLCRCTGYVPILEAGSSLDPGTVPRLRDRYDSPVMIEDLRKHAAEAVLVQCRGLDGKQRIFFGSHHLDEALEFKACHPDAVIVSGATELGVLHNKKALEPTNILSLANVPGLGEITCENGVVRIGANATWTQVESFAKRMVPEFYRIIIRFGSPQIRNVATLVGNVAHGSPIADSLPFLFVMDAVVEIVSRRGNRRVGINDFYKGYKRNDLASDEIISGVTVPLPAADELLKLYKVSKRNDLDIATFGAGIRVQRAADVIVRASIAYSGVAPTVVCLPETESFLQGRPFVEESFVEAGRLARQEIEPITDVRGSRDFRLQLAENILQKFYFECAAEEGEPVEAYT